MFTKLMKWLSIATLLLAMFWRFSVGYQILLQFLVCASAVMVMLQAAVARKYFWALVFVAVAVLFNPVLPVALSGKAFPLVNLSCLAMFAVSLGVLKTQRKPRLSIPSITDRTPGSESL